MLFPEAVELIDIKIRQNGSIDLNDRGQGLTGKSHHLGHRALVADDVERLVLNSFVVEPLHGLVTPATVGFDKETNLVGITHVLNRLEFFSDDGVTMFVAGGAATEESECFLSRIPEFVLFARRDRDGVAHFHILGVAFDIHFPVAGSNVVDFLSFWMVVFLSC